MTSRRKATDRDSSLTPLMLQILLVLARREAHGYAMLQEIEERESMPFQIGAGTLYRSISKLQQAGLLDPLPQRPEEHRQRKRYRITNQGRQRVEAEVLRLRRVVRWADSLTQSAEETP